MQAKGMDKTNVAGIEPIAAWGNAQPAAQAVGLKNEVIEACGLRSIRERKSSPSIRRPPSSCACAGSRLPGDFCKLGEPATEHWPSSFNSKEAHVRAQGDGVLTNKIVGVCSTAR
jgi:hypothetical protein